MKTCKKEKASSVTPIFIVILDGKIFTYCENCARFHRSKWRKFKSNSSYCYWAPPYVAFSSRTKTPMMKLTTENSSTTFVYYSLETSSNLEGRKHQKFFTRPSVRHNDETTWSHFKEGNFLVFLALHGISIF